MNSKTISGLGSKISKVIGGIAMLIGAVDPLEGSVIILLGTLMVLVGLLIGGTGDDRLRRDWILISSMTAFGVASLFAISSVGGIGGPGGHSMWWGLLILPYVLGWVMGLVSLGRMMIQEFRRKKARA